MVEMVSKIFADFNYSWLARELQLNLPQELNFEHEAANLNRCRVLLNDMIVSGDLALPEVFNASKRVLVMSFEEVSGDRLVCVFNVMLLFMWCAVEVEALCDKELCISDYACHILLLRN